MLFPEPGVSFLCLPHLFTQLIKAYLSFGSHLKCHFPDLLSLVSLHLVPIPFLLGSVNLNIYLCVHFFVPVLPVECKLPEGMGITCDYLGLLGWAS